MATVSAVIQMEAYGDSSSSGDDVGINSSNGQMADLCIQCPNSIYSKDQNEGTSDSEAVMVETVTSSERCEFDELWSMDPTSVKLKGIALIEDEKFDFNISDTSLESVEAAAITSSPTSDDWVFPKTTTIEDGGVGSGGLPGATDKDCGSWAFPIKTTPTKDSALCGKEPTSGAVIPDRKQAEDWVFSKMFQLDTGESESCSEPLDAMGTDPFSGLDEEVLARLRDTAPSPPPQGGDSIGGVSSADVGTSDDRSAGNSGRGVVTRGPNKAKMKVGTNRENRNSAASRMTSCSSGGNGAKSSRISKISQPAATTGIPRVNSKPKLSKIAPKRLPGPSIKPMLLPRAVPSKGRVPADVSSNKLGTKPTFKSKLAKPALPGSRLNGKVAVRPDARGLVKRDTTFLKSERTFIKSEHQTAAAPDAGKCDTTRDLQNSECCAPVVGVAITAPSASAARVVQSTPKERPRTSEQVARGETVTKEVHCLRHIDITPIAKVTATTTTTTTTMSPPKTCTKAKCGDEKKLQLNETHSVSRPGPTNAASAPNLVTPKSRVGRRSLIPTPRPQGQKDGEKLDLTNPIKYDASTQMKRKSLFGKEVADERALNHMGMSPQLDGDKENAFLPVVKRVVHGSGLQRPSKVRGGKRGEENASKVGVAAVRGRRGPFRPLNGLASRQVEALSPVYSYTVEGENMLVSHPKVVHSPADKENIPTTPLSKWSPIKKKHNLDDSCFRCTKKL